MSQAAAMVSSGATPVWRSLLYVPANRDRFVEKAASAGADAIQLDLEDGVAPGEKARARDALPAAVRRLADCPSDLIVRVNRPFSLAVRDIEAAVCAEVKALSLPKVESADQVRLIAEIVAEAEAAAGMRIGATRLIVGIETPGAWLRMAEIAGAHERVTAMLLGTEDFSAAIGMSPSPENMLAPKQALVIAAAAAGVTPLGLVGSFADFRDVDAFAAMVARSRALGFRGSSCIHPDQVPLLNAGFSPAPAEVEKARAIVAAFDQAAAAGSGAVALDGAMLDLPVVNRARATLDLQRRVDRQADRR